MMAATAPIAMKAVQFISRSKFFGLPFEARYPMTAAAVGANTKNASTTNAAYADARMSDCVMQKTSQVRRMTSIESITSVGVINEVRGKLGSGYQVGALRTQIRQVRSLPVCLRGLSCLNDSVVSSSAMQSGPRDKWHVALHPGTGGRNCRSCQEQWPPADRR